MIPLDLVSLSAGSGFNEAFDEWCSDKADYFSSEIGFILDFRAVLGFMLENSLLVSVFVVLLIVLAFHLFPLIIRTFRR